MSRLLFMVTKKPQMIAALPRSLSSLLSSKMAAPQLRSLTSKAVQPADQSKVAVANTGSELDKAQWERSDRFKIFYGFNDKDEADDKATAHFFTFLGLFGFIMLPFFLIYYYPDYKTTDWCHREAYLELARREKAGEPLVNPDYVPVESIKLPTDEELGDMEIVI